MRTDPWQKVGRTHHHGIDLPLSAIHTEKSCGIGEYLDLIPLIDWVSDVGFDTIMLLPLNDSGPDPSPYNALSATALHPIYISLTALENIAPFQVQIDDLQALTKTKRVEYHTVLEKKETLLREYFTQNYPSYQDHVEAFGERFPALKTYALFKYFKEAYEGRNFSDWPEKARYFNQTHLKELLKHHKEEIAYHLFVQYLCFTQMQTVRAHARKKNIFLKGDIPILISPDSADVWAHPEYFDLTYAAGAPPDQFTPDGQYWGFPIYNWEAIAQDDFAWWRSRLEFASQFYDIYRLDHIIGFFRIFAIPRGQPPSKGNFIPSEEWEATAQGRMILEKLLTLSPMLPIGEDLGFMPEGAAKVLHELGICGTKVLRWECDFKTHTYFPFNTYSPLSMSTVSTHDSTTLSQWWQESLNEVKGFCQMMGWEYTPKLTPERRLDILKAVHQSNSLFHINLIGEYLALCPELIHQSDDDERINIPGTMNASNWTYRIKENMEYIQFHSKIRNFLKSLS